MLKKRIIRIYENYICRILFYINPKISANLNFRYFFKQNINWDDPKNLIEKIFWLQFNSDTSLWSMCADKYRVRDYVEECGFKEALPELYGKWDNAKDIDWDKLPNSFVLKTNNGCGTNIIVKDRLELNIKPTIKKLNNWLSASYGYNNSQMHYIKIKPCIIAEELLLPSRDDKIISPDSLIDYKIWCFEGVPESILVVHNRENSNYLLSFYDLKWNNITEGKIVSNKHKSYNDIPKPKSLDKMIEMAKILSKNLPQVRIDFYDIDGKPYFGEMTFTTGYGNYTKEYYDYLGSKIDLNKVEKKSH